MQQLNIFELYKSINDKKASKINHFEQVLLKCHAKIKLAAKNNHFACFFEVPEFVIGLPLFNVTECITYIINALKDNGFVVKYLYPKTVYVSWDPKVVNKTEIESQGQSSSALDSYDNYLIAHKPKNNNWKFVLNVDDKFN
jgi:hypothetical protein